MVYNLEMLGWKTGVKYVHSILYMNKFYEVYEEIFTINVLGKGH